jgi:hypothetical protein
MPPVQEVRAVLTQRGANALAQITAGFITTAGVTHFRIGEGGFIDVSGTKFPKEPTNVQKVLDSDDPALIPSLTAILGHPPFVFQKSFTPLGSNNNFQIETGVVFRANPLVDFSEANDNGVGGAPRFFEIGYYLSNTQPLRQIGVGDGVTTQFSFTLPTLPVDPLSFTISTVSPVQSGTDDGLGFINPGSGVDPAGPRTINYQTGAVTVKFLVAPASGTAINVAYTSTPLFVYGTFPEEIKTNLIQLKKIMRVAY